VGVAPSRFQDKGVLVRPTAVRVVFSGVILVCRGTLARVTIGRFRHLTLQKL
jgi:hypothetical protein